MLNDEQQSEQQTSSELEEVLLDPVVSGKSLSIEEDQPKKQDNNDMEEVNIVVFPDKLEKENSSRAIVLPENQRSEDQLEKVRRRQEIYFQTRRQKKKKKIFYNRLKLFLKLLFTLCFIVTVYLVGNASFWKFNLNSISLEGNNLLGKEHIRQFFEPFESKAIYKINPIALERDIKKNISLVKEVYIRRHLFPVSVEVAVIEKPSWGVLYLEPPVFEDQLEAPIEEAAQDENQADNSIEKKADKKSSKPAYLLHWDNSITDLASYSVKAENMANLGNPVPIVAYNVNIKPKTLNIYREIVYILFSQPDKAKLLYLDASNPFDIYAFFEDFKVRIGRADSSAPGRVKRLFSVLPAIREYKEELGFVDLRWQHQTIFKKKTTEEIFIDKQRRELKQKLELPYPVIQVKKQIETH